MLRVVQVCDGLRRRGTGTGHCRQCSARDSAVRPDRGTTKAITLRDRSGHLQDVLTLGPVQGPRSFCWAALPFIAGVGGADLPSPYHPSGRRANSRSISYPRGVAWPAATGSAMAARYVAGDDTPKAPPVHACQRQLNSQISTLKLHHHRLLLGVVLIPMSAALPPNPRLLIPTKRQRRIKGHVLIDPHNAGLQTPRNLVCTA
jgi:hypothetical protein